MAEYVNVMEQKRKMCNSYALCSMGCPLNDIDCCSKNAGEKINADFPEIERRTMAWAAEHPDPVYPTWMEWLTDLGAIPKAISWDEPLVEAVYDAIQEHIPAAIAQKLGIEPKEGA